MTIPFLVSEELDVVEERDAAVVELLDRADERLDLQHDLTVLRLHGVSALALQHGDDACGGGG